MIRILHFANVINRYDFIDTVLTNLDRSKFEVSALTIVPPTIRTGEYTDEESYDSRCLNIPFRRRNYRRIYSELKNHIGQFRPHILQTHHYDETVMGVLAAKSLKVPAFVIGRQYSDHIYVLTEGVKRHVYLRVEAYCNQYADRIVVPTQEVVDLLQRQGVDEEKIVKSPYGTDFGMLKEVSNIDVEMMRKEHGLEGKFVALVCCRLNKEKGLDLMLKAVHGIVKDFPSYRLVIVGTGPYDSELRRLQSELGLEHHVKFMGWRTDALNWYALSDVVVQPSLAESFCQVVTESMAMKRPIIVTPVGIAPEVIVNGERGGYLVPIGDIGAIVEAMRSLVENPERRRILAERGHDFVRENLSVEATAKRYERIYEDILREKMIAV